MEPDYAKLAMDVFDEINLARQVPNALVAGLNGKLEFFDDKLFKYPGYTHPIETYEGDKAVNYFDSITHFSTWKLLNS